ncbi:MULTISPECIES: UDP-glucose 4-epimerase GalE [Clostridium]|uniref:UDP-glucose 4-epimerase n=1 Tax=Clostridium paraputrificum TaxID=29363 RepID=A0A1B8RS81_9CLOT|nr:MULTISPECIES: UDP-glucose 4-epimerase GalE [Clostridium]MDB2103271.1 UDP-glucose 4-epimerase GalE [Clostridium paraputrificum]MDB2124202.1 UDP-glucose 4-epimerase GalE [Clostridium paraputrificum]MDC0801336.1 UDP-glucose 4-epimerase GalE [Clostridium paraputrificum]MDU1585093.1 UDP-glucose 4-epimerase GalE [Clostridium sp.]MDU6520996.1 UDP-glucose 4-epimerase GalE [Clostridium sp.]
MAVLVTGGLGYIGSHTVVELLENNEEVVIVDNLLNSKLSVKDRIEEITNKGVKYYNIDLVNEEDVRKVFNENRIESVIHFAALKAVGESVEKPIEYFHNNLVNTLVVLKIMKEFSVKNFVFSSSATVYGNAKEMPIKENFSLSVTNPYGRTKLMIEDILRDVYFSDNSWNIAILRYFNPVGANKSGRIGEDPNGIPNNIMPYITKVAIGELKQVNVFGNDYPTIDGTGVRDYIHVVDLAKGHIKALDKLKSNCGLVTYNLGTGKGYSVLELIKAFSEASGKEIPFEITERRAGDVAICYADPSKANSELGWKAERDINDMCKDSWKWQTMNPMGYQ